jgi:hypothetical protein
MYKYIIIGGGVSGLYTGYLLRKQGIENFVIVEKDAFVGGRNKQTQFHGTTIQLGAGVVRQSDKRVLGLFRDLQIPTKTFTNEFHYNIPDYSKGWYHGILKTLKKTNKITFRDSLMKKFKGDKAQMNRFINHALYTDFFSSTTSTTFKNYPKRDLYHHKNTYTVALDGYYSLVKALYEKVKDKVVLNSQIQTALLEKESAMVEGPSGRWEGEFIIFTVPIKALKKINFTPLPPRVKYIQNYIGTNTFIRMYTFHDSVEMTSPVLTSTIFKQIIPINKHVVMSCYSDNENSLKAVEYIQTASNVDLTKMINSAVGEYGKVSTVKDKIIQFWESGTHYYKPGYNIKTNYIVDNRILVCGEVVAYEQGWTEGCIHSVDSLLKNIKMKGRLNHT